MKYPKVHTTCKNCGKPIDFASTTYYVHTATRNVGCNPGVTEKSAQPPKEKN